MSISPTTDDYNSYQESRQIPFLATKATAAPVGNEYNTDVDGGFEFHGKALTFGPVLALQYVHEDVNGFSESGASGADLAVQSQTVDSLRSRIGAQGRYSFQICNQVAIAPHLLATWQHEYLESSDSLHTQFANLGDAPFTVDLDKTDRDAAFVDAGADTKFNNALLMFIDYQAQAGQSNYFAQSVNGGVKVSF